MAFLLLGAKRTCSVGTVVVPSACTTPTSTVAIFFEINIIGPPKQERTSNQAHVSISPRNTRRGHGRTVGNQCLLAIFL